ERYLATDSWVFVVTALWVLYTYCFDKFSISPILAITSPEKRCGKTTLLKILSRLVSRPIPTSNMTASSIFRVIEACHPTLLIDEADSFLRDNEDMRGILNGGNSIEFSNVMRSIGRGGGDFEPQVYSVWYPKAIALIGQLPDTLEDRSIVVRMQRKSRV